LVFFAPFATIGVMELADHLEWTFEGIHFNGESSKVVIDENPLASCSSFAVEVDFCPEAGGESEQRFLHIQGDDGSRMLMELRSTPAGWYGDVFVHFPGGERFLNDPSLLHPFGESATLRLTYTGTELQQFVNGQHELSGFAPSGVLAHGRTSVGMRLNGVSPFKGKINAIRFYPMAAS